MDLGNIVYQSEPCTRPLYIYFQFRAQSKTMHAPVHLLAIQVAHALTNPQTLQVRQHPLLDAWVLPTIL